MESSSHGPGGGDDAKAPNAVSDTVSTVEGAKKPEVQQKPVLKKPDKLAPCPRCDSLDTKFCYYNNYNVNQPRHFCKNCQRYWTAGGTLRNVPVGAGRRKNKHGSLQARHGQEQVVRPCHVPSPQSVPDQISPPLASSSSDPGSQDRAVSSSSLQAARRHFVPAEPQASISSERGGSRLRDAEHGASCDPEAEKEDCTEACTSSAQGYSSELDAAAPAAQEAQSTIRVPAAAAAAATTATTTTLQPVVVRGVGVLDASVWAAAQAPFGLFNGSWPFGYNVGWSGPPPGTNPICPPGSTLVTCQPTVGGIAAWSAPPNGLWPGVCWGSTLIPGMPPGLVGSPWMTPGWGGAWSMPWGGDAAAAAAAAASASMQAAPTAVPSPPCANGTGFPSRLPIRPVLSKHPRDRLDLERVESSLWVPKMVRVDDPGNVPRSSVWTAVGAENRLESVAPGSNFKAFLPVRDDTNNNNDNKASSVTSGDNKKRVASLSS